MDLALRKIVDVRTGAGARYPVFAGDDLGAFFRQAWRPACRQAVIIGDDNTAALFGDAVQQALPAPGPSVLRLSFAAGELHKTRETKARLEDAMLDAGIERGACVIGVGGGIALDMAGFVAATFLRGIPVIHVATSLLAQVDASVGGKTAVNTPHGKNLIGAFHAPSAVLLATGALASLPPEEYRNGLAEVVKMAVIGDALLFATLEQIAREPGAALPQSSIERCVQLKADVVGADEHESGLRQILNFGHTIAHAVESGSAHSVAHGSAVAFGMLVEARAAESLVGLPAEQRARIDRVVDGLGLAAFDPPPFDRVAPLLGSDKKTRDGLVRCALPVRLGVMDEADGQYARPVSIETLRQSWTRALSETRAARGGGGR